MKKKWFYIAQRLYKDWLAFNLKQTQTVKQIITETTLEEIHYVESTQVNGPATLYTLKAYKNTGEVTLTCEQERKIIVLRNRLDLI